MAFKKSKSAMTFKSDLDRRLELEKEIDLYTNDPDRLYAGHFGRGMSITGPRSKLNKKR